jgi:hypothetical protein
MKKFNLRVFGLFSLLILTGLACQLTSPTPASWAGTPTAEARNATNAAINRTQQAELNAAGTETPTPMATEPAVTATPKPTTPVDGPWVVFPAPEPGLLWAYDMDAGVTLEIALPEPIIVGDLVDGLSPDGHTLVVRAGSALNTDELALYKIDLPSTTVTKLTPLLSLTVQRKIVNEEGTRAFDTLRAIIAEGGLAWSPDGRYLAFSAALEFTSSDLYLWNAETGSLERLNGLYSHSASPVWSPGGNWLIAQEMGEYSEEAGARAEVVTGLRIPGFNDQNTLYLPSPGSQGEVFLGWLNAQTLMSYSQTAAGPVDLRQVNVEAFQESILLGGAFKQAALDPQSASYAFILSEEQALEKGLLSGVYLVRGGSGVRELQMAGEWSGLAAAPGGMFLASGPKGLIGFSVEGSTFTLAEERMASISPSGNWMVAWGTDEGGESGARLYQSPSGRALQQLTDLPVQSVIWQSDSTGLFLVADGAVYHLAFPELSMDLIAEGFDPAQELPLIWAE